jgi:hypothetical protein
MQQPHTILADGTPIEMFENTERTNPLGDPLLGRTKTFGRFKDDAAFNDEHTVPTSDYRLVVFHYVTRSQEQFVEMKLKRVAVGEYGSTYRQMGGDSPEGLYSPRLMARFEHEEGLDGEQPVCSSVVDRGYVERCCGDSSFVKQLLQTQQQ